MATIPRRGLSPWLSAATAAALAWGTPAAAIDAPAAFLLLKDLAGDWSIADRPDSPLRIRFAVTAGGTVVTETWAMPQGRQSLTVYHLDGAGLIATHYCPLGNQPRLDLSAGSDADTISFAFKDATNLASPAAEHLHALSFRPTGRGRLRRTESYISDGKLTTTVLELVAGEPRQVSP